LSNSAPTFDDAYVPQALEGVEAVEVVSKSAGRRYIIIHPEDGRLQSLDVKDHFVWEKMTGQSSLAQVKQDYYGKFKVLPTQHIIEIVRSWYENGFLTDRPQNWKAQKEALSGWWGIPLPAIIFRNLIGPFASLLVNPMMAVVLWAVSLIGLGWLLFQKGPLFLHQPFEELSVPLLLLYSMLGVYIASVLQVIFRFGGLWKGCTYRYDRILCGAWLFFPGLVIGERGLDLKPPEQVLVLRVLEWLAPLLVMVVASLMAEFVVPAPYQSVLLTLALGASLAFAMSSCPFMRHSLVKCLEAFAFGVRLRELREAFSQNALIFVDDYGLRAVKVIKTYMGSVMVWVVVGSSYLLYTMLRAADLLGIWGRNALGLGDASFKFWQMLVYAPVLLGFFWMLWKLIEPFVVRLMQYSAWKDERLLAPVTCFIVVLLIPAQFILSSLLMQCGYGLLVLLCIYSQYSSALGTSFVHRIWKLVFIILLCLSVGTYVLPEQASILTWSMSSLWLSWSLGVGVVFSVQSPRWFLRWLGTAFLLAAGLMAALQGDLFQPFTLYVLSFSLWASFAVWTFEGMFGVQMLAGALASVLFGLSSQIRPQWIYLVLAIVMSHLPLLGWNRCRKRYAEKLALGIVVDSENPAKGALETLRAMATLLMGSWMASDLLESSRSQPRMLKTFSLWVKPWLGRKGWAACLRHTLSSVPWEERLKLQDDTNLKLMSRLECSETLSLDKRLLILHSQLCFKGFKKAELELLANYLEVGEYEDDEMILEQGDEAHPYLEIIVKGRIILERLRPGGDVSVLAELGSLDSLRAEDLFKSVPYDFSARSLDKVITVKLYRQHLLVWALGNSDRMQKMIESVNLADMIKSLSLFRDFSPAQVRLVMEKLKQKKVSSGVNIITQGEDGDEFFLLDEGRVEIIVNGNKVAQLGAGSYFGEIALLEKCKRTATVRTTESSLIYSLEQSDFDRFFAAGRGAQVLKNVSSLRTAEAVL
jgi:CRP-like cAMP-binding protein